VHFIDPAVGALRVVELVKPVDDEVSDLANVFVDVHMVALSWRVDDSSHISSSGESVWIWMRSLVTMSRVMMILLLFLQKQNLASAIYLFGLGTRLSGHGLKHMR